MTPERWQQIDVIFHAAADRAADERDAFLCQVCGDDSELRREVESLLAHEVSDTFIKGPIQDAASSMASREVGAEIDARIGVYQVTGLIGCGGMGNVYRAVRDDDQYQQEVAIKVVKRGMDTAFVLDRFRHERQILATLQHPHIARLLDGGTTENGLPYFVMEYIEGQSITAYCDTHHLSIPERLKLFGEVCAAVGYAHQKLIVHRDLKPGNILVTSEGAPKLLDFGIAKLLTPDVAAQAAPQTATEMRMMTPDYASPEQVRGLPITTATDVYSLGAVLYELLTGERPHRIKHYSPSEIERAICETETEKPSAIVSRKPHTPARQRKQLSRQITGDLDNIVQMAMRKEPERRYGSVEQFTEDIRRHLQGRPVIARQDTIGYRASKFARRHRLGLAATALVIFSLAAGIVVATYQARRAERRFQQVRKLANTVLFDFHDKIQNLSGSTEAREMLVKTALEYLDSLPREAAGDTSLEWELAAAYEKIGDVQGNPRGPNLGHPEAAMQSYEKAVHLAQKLAARDPADINILYTLAACQFKLGDLQAETGNKPGGLETMRSSLNLAESLAQRNLDPRHRILVENLYIRLGDVQLDTGDAPGALESYRFSREMTERRARESPSDDAQFGLALGYSHVGEALGAYGDVNGAIDSYREAARIIEELVKKQPANPIFRAGLRIQYNWIGNFSGNPFHINLGDRAAALRYYRRGLGLAQSLAAEDPKNAAAQLNLATNYALVADMISVTDADQATAYYRLALSITHALLEAAPGELRLLRKQTLFLRGFAALQRKLGDRQAALQHLRESLQTLKDWSSQHVTNPQVEADLHATLTGIAGVSLDSGDLAGAEAHSRLALAIADAGVAAHPSDSGSLWRLADSYSDFGKLHAALASRPRLAPAKRVERWREARAWYQKSLDVWDRWNQQTVSTVFNITRREQVARALAQCDLALTGLVSQPDR